MNSETVWTFETARFSIRLEIETLPGYQYDGDDEDGSIQASLDDRSYVAFDSSVVVEFDGEEIGRDSLGSSVYAYNRVKEFWSDHRDANPLNRNCSFMRQVKGTNCCICHYFPDMVRQAISIARGEIIANAAKWSSVADTMRHNL